MGEAKPTTKKLVVVGDGAVGKTCLLMSYSGKPFNPQYVPTVFDNYTTEIDLPSGQSIRLSLWDTAGQEEYDRIRVMSYVNVDCFLVCFSVADNVTLKNVRDRWVPELKRYSAESPFILVGTKEDLRGDDEAPSDTGRRFVTYEEGKQLKAEISAESYLECSAITERGIKAVFDAAIKVVTEGSKRGQQRKKRCVLF